MPAGRPERSHGITGLEVYHRAHPTICSTKLYRIVGFTAGERKVDAMFSRPRNSCSLTPVVLVFQVLFEAGSVSAQVPTPTERCSDRDDSPDDRIAACTSILNSGRASGSTLVTAHINRGAAHARKGDYERAAADFSAAICTDPNNARAYRGRANAQARIHKFDQAIDDD